MSSRYAHDGYCPICLAVFPTRHRNILHISGRGSKGFNACLLNLMASQELLSDTEVRTLDNIDRAAAKANRRLCRTIAYAEAPCLNAYGPARPIVVCPGMTRRSTTMSLGVALSRAIEIPVEIPLIATGVLGHCMQVDITTLASLAKAALALQSDCASFNDIDE